VIVLKYTVYAYNINYGRLPGIFHRGNSCTVCHGISDLFPVKAGQILILLKMSNLQLIFIFFAGLILLFFLGRLAGFLLKLDEKLEMDDNESK
jgi:hypothetical protein